MTPTESTDRDGHTLACPECDKAGNVYRRKRHESWMSNPDDRFRCGQCGATFDEPVERQIKRRGPTVGLAHTLWKMGLDGDAPDAPDAPGSHDDADDAGDGGS